jgi:hypothetical protein
LIGDLHAAQSTFPTPTLVVLQRTSAHQVGATEAVLVLSKKQATAELEVPGRGIVRMQLLGSNADTIVQGVDELPGIKNYFLGNNPEKWRSRIPTYAKVRYSDIYSGIDLMYYGNGGKLEFDFLVASGADPQ